MTILVHSIPYHTVHYIQAHTDGPTLYLHTYHTLPTIPYPTLPCHTLQYIALHCSRLHYIHTCSYTYMHCLASCKSLLHILIVRLLTYRTQQLGQVHMGKLPDIIETSVMTGWKKSRLRKIVEASKGNAPVGFLRRPQSSLGCLAMRGSNSNLNSTTSATKLLQHHGWCSLWGRIAQEAFLVCWIRHCELAWLHCQHVHFQTTSNSPAGRGSFPLWGLHSKKIPGHIDKGHSKAENDAKLHLEHPLDPRTSTGNDTRLTKANQKSRTATASWGHHSSEIL